MNDEHTTDDGTLTNPAGMADATVAADADLAGQAETVRVVLAEVGASAPAMDTDTLAALIVKVLHDSQHASDA